MLKILKSVFAEKKAVPPQDATTDDRILLNAYCSNGHPPPMAFPHDLLGDRDHGDPELGKHLDGFMGYVQSRGDGVMTRTRYHLLRHIQKVQRHISVVVPAEQLDAFHAWALEANAILFLQNGNIHDPAGLLLQASDGADEDPAAQIPYPQDAFERKARTDRLLAEQSIHVPSSLPPVIAVPEVSLRSPQEVAARVLALFAVALRAEFLSEDKTLSADEIGARLPLALAAATPRELAFLHEATPAAQDLAQFGWRYECVNVLAWAIGLIDKLPFPAEICNVGQLASLVIDADAEQLLSSAALRPAAELIDALDLHYRLHWAVRQAHIDGKNEPDGMISGVVLERHYALNWLTRFENADWDDVDTPT